MDAVPVVFSSEEELKKACCPLQCPHKRAVPWDDVLKSGRKRRYPLLSVGSSTHAFFCDRYNSLLGTFTIGSLLFGNVSLLVARPRFCDQNLEEGSDE